MTDTRTCHAVRYGRGTPCNEEGPAFDVVAVSPSGAILDRHPACFRHGLAEVERSLASGSIADVHLVEPGVFQ